MSVQRGDRYVLLRVARHLNPHGISTPPPTPKVTHTKAPPSGGGTARHNTPFQAATLVRNLGEPGGGTMPLDKLNRS